MTEVLAELFKSHLSKTVYIITSIIFCVAPPYLATYVLNHNFFLNTDTLKLLLFTTSIGVVIYSTNFMLMYVGFVLDGIIENIKDRQNKKKSIFRDPYKRAAQQITILYAGGILFYIILYIISGKLPDIINLYKIYQAGWIINFVLTIIVLYIQLKKKYMPLLIELEKQEYFDSKARIPEIEKLLFTNLNDEERKQLKKELKTAKRRLKKPSYYLW